MSVLKVIGGYGRIEEALVTEVDGRSIDTENLSDGEREWIDGEGYDETTNKFVPVTQPSGTEGMMKLNLAQIEAYRKIFDGFHFLVDEAGNISVEFKSY